MNITVEPPRRLPISIELGLLRQALSARPGTSSVRKQLARLLTRVDAFDEVIALLSTGNSQELCAQTRHLLVTALFARSSESNTAHAAALLADALKLELSKAERASVLADLAKARRRSGDEATAFELLETALKLDPASDKALHRLARERLLRQQFSETLVLTEGLVQQGVVHSRLMATRTMAFAGSGDIDAARHWSGLPAFLSQSMVEVPSGWASLSEFNLALSAEITGNPDLRYGRFGTSSIRTWRVDDPSLGQVPAVRALLERVAAQANRTAATYRTAAANNHPWLAATPRRAVLRSWCVMAEGEGYEQWHMHPEGWMSGVYYVQAPQAVVTGVDPAGCLGLGLPGGLIGDAAAHCFGETLLRPEPGLLALFPSQVYHHSYPHRTAERRICIAFDICPQ